MVQSTYSSLALDGDASDIMCTIDPHVWWNILATVAWEIQTKCIGRTNLDAERCQVIAKRSTVLCKRVICQAWLGNCHYVLINVILIVAWHLRARHIPRKRTRKLGFQQVISQVRGSARVSLNAHLVAPFVHASIRDCAFRQLSAWLDAVRCKPMVR